MGHLAQIADDGGHVENGDPLHEIDCHDPDPYVILRAHITEQKRNIVFLEATISNTKGEVCTKAVCTYFTFSPEKVRDEMRFLGCETENEEVNPLP